MIQNIVQEVEQHFLDNFNYCDVNYDTLNYINKNDYWLELIVVPILSESKGVDISCTKEHYELHTISYSLNNKVESGNVADASIAFLQNTKLDTLNIRTWKTIDSGMLDNGTYFFKLIFDCDA